MFAFGATELVLPSLHVARSLSLMCELFDFLMNTYFDLSWSKKFPLSSLSLHYKIYGHNFYHSGS